MICYRIMTDKQKEKLYKEISDWNHFINKANSKEDISLNERVSIKFDKDASFVNIIFPESTEVISIDEFNIILSELGEQRTSDLNFQDRLRNRVSDMEFNIDHGAKTFLITEAYVMNLTYGSDISSAQGWYIKQLKEAVRLFGKNYTLFYKERVFKTKEEFADAFLKGLHNKFESIDDEIEKYENRYGKYWYEKP